MSPSQFTNRLINETSPYLQQHAHNPIEWFPWGPEAFNKAKQEDKPVFLSIGYSACHWCHVMANESFENIEIAKLANELFVNVKVDREERPDIDALYMKAIVELTGHGGWPLSIFLTPDQEPYFGGTYYPPKSRNRQPGFKDVLNQAYDLYKSQKDQLGTRTRNLLTKIQSKNEAGDSNQEIPVSEFISKSTQLMAERFDETYGGFGGGMKFPEPMIYALLLRHWWKNDNNEAIMMVDKSLTKMAEGGMYDQLGGGFHRYSTDRKWLVPHFEKMLYDNALLTKLFLETFQATKQEIYERIPCETLDYILREMTSEEGGFFSSQDADTEEGEGSFFLWQMREVLDLLGPRHAKVFCRIYGITSAGNFQKKNVLHLKDSLETISDEEGIPIFEVSHIAKTAKQTLFQAREKRKLPFVDEKILTGWNGMMIGAMAYGYFVLRNPEYLKAASKAANFIWDRLRENEKLYRVYKDGQSKVLAGIEDYSWYLDGLLRLYEASLDLEWINKAKIIADEMIKLFWDISDGGFFMTGSLQENLIARIKDSHDEAIPSSNSIAAKALIKLGRLTGNTEYSLKGRKTIQAFQGSIELQPAAHSSFLDALEYYDSPPLEVVISGDENDKEYLEMLKVIYQDYRPNLLLVGYKGEKTFEIIPWAQGRGPVSGKTTAYVCKDNSCHPPVHDSESLNHLLGRPPRISLNIFDQEKQVQDMQSREQDNFLNAMSDIFKYSGLGKKR